MRRVMMLLAAAGLGLIWGCKATVTNGNGNSNTSNDNAVIVPSDNSGGSNGNSSSNNDNHAANENGSTGGNENGAAGNDNGDDSGDLPVAFRLDGVWKDNGRTVIVEQNGTQVAGTYYSEWFCNLDTGSVPVGQEPEPGDNVQSTFHDFDGVLNNGPDVLPGDMIVGNVSTCRFGYDDGSNGIVMATMNLTVVDEDNLGGIWYTDSNGDGEHDYEGTISLTRQQ